jgi:hypothetical protein
MTNFILIITLFLSSCKKSNNPGSVNTIPLPLNILTTSINDKQVEATAGFDFSINPTIKLRLNNAVERASVAKSITLAANYADDVLLNYSFENNDSTIVIKPASVLSHLTKYQLQVNTTLKSSKSEFLNTPYTLSFNTQIDSTDKFKRVSNDQLLDIIQQQTFKYFWDFGHPISGLARERNASGDIVTSGGSGFGIMAIPVAIHRNFITREQGLQRMATIVDFLKNKAQKFHGAFPHWLNGATGVVVPFSTKDNGADLVETSYLVAGLWAAREYFNNSSPAEIALRTDINTICDAVEWNWFQQNNQDVLYWHWSPNYNWEMNHKIIGWNECLITYIMAASSNKYAIPASVYHKGFAASGAMINNKTYFGYTLPLGPSNGGPLFWAHYSFLGINPNGLKDQYADYQQQVINHTKINYEYCKLNPKKFYGYSKNCWGLTASDIPNGYSANEPNNDIGVITPTAALSSFPYTPVESMQALQFFYYTLGDKIFTEYGFMDAFKLQSNWYSNTTLAIDQGPIIVMIENHRSQLIWNLLSNCSEVKRGMKTLGFTAPYIN